MSSSKSYPSSQLTRRRFLRTSAPAAALTVLPRHVLGKPGFVAPNDKIHIGFVGSGTQGIRQLMKALPYDDVHIDVVCDPNRESTDYVEWSKNEIRDKIRKFLKEPTYGRGIDGCRCGRQVGKEIIETYYSKIKKSNLYKGCKTYKDFRLMLEQESGLDAVYIMTPGHLHATIALAAMNKGKHAITHKPISNVLHEIKLAVKKARETGLATHLFCSADMQTTPTLCEWIWNDAIGPVHEVHNWSSRPFWPQGMIHYPPQGVPVPKGLDWDLWLGPVPHKPYHPTLTHAVFRGWLDFGSGALGDMGHYSFYQIFKIMKLQSPTHVESNRSQYWEIINHLWKKQVNTVSYPRSSIIHWQFPEREGMPPLSLYWYDGGLRPPKPEELDMDHKSMPEEGLLFVGEKGKILAGFSGGDPTIIPSRKMKEFKKPPTTLPRPIGEFEQWIRACRGIQPSDASFPSVSSFSEAIAMGNIALRVPEKLAWDSTKKEFSNSSEANRLMHRKYRPGWEL